MKKCLLKIVLLVLVSSFGVVHYAYALPACTCEKPMQVNIIANCQIDDTSSGYCEAEKGDSIMHVLGLVIDIFSIGIGILAVVGIMITGIQYLTAGGNEEKVRKSKRRMLEIVIGVAIWVVLYGLMNWLGIDSESVNQSGFESSESGLANGSGGNSGGEGASSFDGGDTSSPSGGSSAGAGDNGAESISPTGLPPNGSEGWIEN